MKKFIIFVFIAIFLNGCATKSHFTSLQDNAKITVGKTEINGNMPVEGSVSRTTFGKYPVKAVKDGYDPVYFNLPLKVSPGVIILDALLFAPAAFFNVQGSAPFYEIDFETNTVRYKASEDGVWQTYQPTVAQKMAAKSFFGD